MFIVPLKLRYCNANPRSTRLPLRSFATVRVNTRNFAALSLAARIANHIACSTLKVTVQRNLQACRYGETHRDSVLSQTANMQHSSENIGNFPVARDDPGAALVQIHFTPEEMAMLKECSREAFFKRSLPLGTACCYGTYYAIKSGYLKPHVKYGPIPAVMVGGLIGALVGSFTYKASCIQRVLALPNSSLKKQIEAARQQQKPVVLNPIPFTTERTELDPETQMISGTQMESYSSTSSFDGYSGVDIDSDQPTKFNNSFTPLAKYEGPSQTYDELRRKNREDYIRSTSSRLPQQQPSDPRSIRPQPVLPEDRPRFDRDRVPQYQLVD